VKQLKEVTVIFKSGQKASFTVDEFKTFKNGFGAIKSLEWSTEGLSKHLLYLNANNVDAIFTEDIEEGETLVEDNDHPVEDVYGEEILQDDTYFMFGQDVVLQQNLKTYLIERQQVQCFQAQ
jgi:hypothetical protein